MSLQAAGFECMSGSITESLDCTLVGKTILVENKQVGHCFANLLRKRLEGVMSIFPQDKQDEAEPLFDLLQGLRFGDVSASILGLNFSTFLNLATLCNMIDLWLKIQELGLRGFSLWFHLPRCHSGTFSLSHSQFLIIGQTQHPVFTAESNTKSTLHEPPNPTWKLAQLNPAAPPKMAPEMFLGSED